MPKTGAAMLILTLCLVTAGCGYKTNPRPASATIPAEVGLVSAAAYPDKIVLTWDVPTKNVDGSPVKDLSGFKVYRSTGPIGEECQDCDATQAMHANVDVLTPVSATVRNGEVVYTDKEVTAGRVYHYSVAAYNLKGREGSKSQMVSIIFDEPPPAPRGLTATSSERGVVLRWEAPAKPAGIRSYRIYRRSPDDPKEMKRVGNTRWAETYFVDRDLEHGKTYVYEVRSLKMNQGIPLESSPSSPAQGTKLKSETTPPTT